jgi:hypothetical protein
MLTEEKRLQILECVTTGEWGIIGDIITRNDMMEYLMFYTNPTITEKGLKIKKLPKIDCPLCGSPTKPQAFSMTKRNVLYLMCASFLSKQDIAKGGSGYIHHEVLHDFCQGKFKHDKGKRLGNGYSITSYSPLTKAPWDLLEARVKNNDKVQRDGSFKVTDKCVSFLHGDIAIPVRIEILNGDVVRYSNKLIYAVKVPDINFQQCVEIFKTF